MTDREIVSRLEHIIAVQRERIQQLVAEVRAAQENADEVDAD